MPHQVRSRRSRALMILMRKYSGKRGLGIAVCTIMSVVGFTCATATALAADALSLAWSKPPDGIFSQEPGDFSVIASGHPPYRGYVAGKCATLAQSPVPSTFVLTVLGGFCVLVVQDAAGEIRALNVAGGDNRAFLSVNRTDDPLRDHLLGDARVRSGRIMTYQVRYSLAMGYIATPYRASVVGNCASVLSSNSPENEPGVFEIVATNPGRCALVFFSKGDFAATSENISVEKGTAD
jgi:hypothetical protein